ncbi:MAG: ankyrin repeat domain-containing protein, partial [Kiritimatiellae bacterium]|nr:ankyrin repeat domain-containing protein [Kiritimatiellia bacterium]
SETLPWFLTGSHLTSGFSRPPRSDLDALLNGILNGQYYVCKNLLDQGISSDGQDRFGLTPLSAAAQRKNPEILSLLLDYGADPDFQDSEGRTALHLLAAEGEGELCHILLDHGASIFIKDTAGISPLLEASRGGDKELVGLFLSRR